MPDNELEQEQEARMQLPGEVIPPAIPPPEVEPEPKDELEDLFEVPQEEDNDMATEDLSEVTEEDVMGDKVVEEEAESFKDLVQTTEEEDEHFFGTKDEQNDGDMSDLVEVTQEDIFGTPPVEKERHRLARPRPRRYPPPPTSLGGIRQKL